MKRIVLLMIEDNMEASKEVKAFSKESANIHIKAPTMQEALTLLKGTEEEALEATAAWKPAPEEPKEEEPKKHYAVSHIAEEDIQEYFRECETDKDGQRLIKSIENAGDFRRKKDNGGLHINTFNYFYMLTHKNAWDGLIALYDYSYRRGYNRALRDRRA